MYIGIFVCTCLFLHLHILRDRNTSLLSYIQPACDIVMQSLQVLVYVYYSYMYIICMYIMYIGACVCHICMCTYVYLLVLRDRNISLLSYIQLVCDIVMQSQKVYMNSYMFIGIYICPSFVSIHRYIHVHTKMSLLLYIQPVCDIVNAVHADMYV
jgi:hypothetical protein